MSIKACHLILLSLTQVLFTEAFITVSLLYSLVSPAKKINIYVYHLFDFLCLTFTIDIRLVARTSPLNCPAIFRCFLCQGRNRKIV